ncbi:dTDP-4-dehydrorhamnose 3,5-epimerase [Fulvivirgaceae bacterium BMA10]|uniref:dTDP-4-dehydrorhamnose 3,5-epimerase n=1 Tax=Splendidivirga corallicola TaxID=3051826 RepID=A0ABT8KHL9_9BACT|nr:dTDP-4-dehydrorhamnose 3,5-epimerase [Fulvivirgaceae bacterium BMA10]
MNITKTHMEGLFILEPQVFEDDRGYFMESYNAKTLKALGVDTQFIQDNQSKSTYGVIRGLHYQKEPYAQTKLVRVLQGEIFDVTLDLRKSSKTYGQWIGVKLSEENKRQLLVPKGFAHGFSVLSEQATILYKTDNYYYPDYDRGIAYNDPELNIDWQIKQDIAIVSDKDKKLPHFKNADLNFNPITL